jgi:hypothetical protein
MPDFFVADVASRVQPPLGSSEVAGETGLLAGEAAQIGANR